MNLDDLDVFMKLGIFMLVLSIICRISVRVLYNVLLFEAGRMEETHNAMLCACRERFFEICGCGRRTGQITSFVEREFRSFRFGILPLRFLPSLALQCMLLGILFFGIGAYRRAANGMFILEAFPFYIAAVAAIYVYLLAASLTDVSSKQSQIKAALVAYFEECEEEDLVSRKILAEPVLENRVGNLSKKARNKDMEKLLKEFLS